MPYRVKAVVPRFYRSQTRGASYALSAWRERLAPDPVEREMALYMRSSDPDYDEELARLSCWRNWQGQPVEPERLPCRLYLKIDDPPLLDLYWPTRAGHAFVASARLRALVEAREPGAHQFIPVELATRKGEAAVGIGKGFAYDDLTLFMSDALFTDVMTQGLQGLAANHRGVLDGDDGQ